MHRLLVLLAVSVTFWGCATASRDRGWLAQSVRARTGHALGPATSEGRAAMPLGVSVADGLSADDAVAIALWRSPALQAELTALDTALADFDEASRPANPRINLLAPIDPRQLSAILFLPIEAIWQTPYRAAAANRELERVSESMIHVVLNVERDVRIAHVDAYLAMRRVRAYEPLVATWSDAARLAEARARAGDIAPAQASAVRAEALLATDARRRSLHDARVANVRLLALIGVPWPNVPTLVAAPVSTSRASASELLTQAMRQRADLRAAELAIHAAAARGRWEHARVLTLVATIDTQADRGALVPHPSVGVQNFELPIFNQNQGGVGRADASLTRAIHQYAATRIAVTAEVLSAWEIVERAEESLGTYDEILSALSEASGASTRSFENGAESYIVVVDALRRSAEAQLRRVELEAELVRAQAELDRAVGGRASGEML